jgi:hypothetical protein
MIAMKKASAKLGIERIVSGGQTGVDRAALDAAIALGIPHGGWCPRGRLAEDGAIPSRYQLGETDSEDYPVRTERNVIDSDGTLILYRGRLWGGTELTRRLAVKHAKPLLLVDLDKPLTPKAFRQWLHAHAVRVLNVAGPRESTLPGIGLEAYRCLTALLAERKRSG